MRRFFIAGVVVSFLGLVVACGGGSVAENKRADEVRDSKDAISGTVGSFYKRYEANAVAADQSYKDRILRVSGFVATIGKGILDEPYIDLADENQAVVMRCSFPKRSEALLANVSKGEAVLIQGRCKGFLVGTVVLEDCAIGVKE